MRVSGGGKQAADGLIPGNIILEWDGDTTDSTPDFDITFWSGRGAPTDLAVGDVILIQKSATGAGAWSTYLTHTTVSDDVAGIAFSVSGVTPLTNATYDFRGRVERGSKVSPWSDIEMATVNVTDSLPHFTILFN